MKILPRLLLVFFLLFNAAELASSQVHVRAYTRRDGMHVRAHTRAAPGTASTTTTAPSSLSAPRRSSSSATADTSTSTNNYTPATDPAFRPDNWVPGRFVEGKYIPGHYDKTTSNPIIKDAATPAASQTPSVTPSVLTPKPSAPGVQRDANGKIKGSEAARRAFMRSTGYPNGRPGYVVDHTIPLERGGLDDPSNMQWQTVEQAKVKDKSKYP